ncbi:MAG: hypothetical protein JW731_12995 [Bacteroidales bacterium]|nr:hypothetical protein [Bacteroidales bacterium]
MIHFLDISVIKLIQVLLVSGIKFLFAPFISIGYGFNYFQTVIFTTVGGILGILFFYFLSKWLIRQYNKYCPLVFSYFTGEKVEKAKKILNCEQTPKKKFTRKNRLIINVRNKYGLFGIILLTPVLLSIPIGAFLAQKYYSRKTNLLIYMSISVVIWSFFISSVFFLF